jgi:hypothetical protein
MATEDQFFSPRRFAVASSAMSRRKSALTAWIDNF